MFKSVTIRDGRDNFFTPLRFLFAFLVMVGHAFVVVGGNSAAEPQIFYHYTLSYLSVDFFFIASGFLVTGSILFRKNIGEYSASRFLRIYPGLIAHVLVMMFLFGPLTTDLGLFEYLTHKDTLKQPLIVLPFIDTEMNLPGILPNNNEHLASAALWTLRYEILAYFGTLIAYCLGLLKHRWMLLAQCLAFVIALPTLQALGIYDDLIPTLQNILRFGLCYAIGVAIYGYREQLKFHILGIPVLIGVSALFNGTAMFETLVSFTLAYILFWATYVKIPALNFLKSNNDYSYGLYIYHWAALQGVYMFMPTSSPWLLFAVGAPVAIIVSVLSWKLVEKPALALKGRLSIALKKTTDQKPSKQNAQ